VLAAAVVSAAELSPEEPSSPQAAALVATAIRRFI
jgi:hypothetical protein